MEGGIPNFCIVFALAFLLVALLKVSEAKADAPPSIGDCLALLKNPTFALAVLGIFLYVGAEVCMGANLIPAFEDHGFGAKEAAFYGPSLFFLLIAVGRLIAGSVKANPRTFFKISAALGLIGVAMVLTGLKMLLIPAVVIAALGFANIWPMLFSITVEEKPERSSELSGLMCMAICGGALVPLLMAWLGGGAVALAFIVPALCFAYLLLLSLRKQRAVAQQEQEPKQG